jgi:hypothetical protein
MIQLHVTDTMELSDLKRQIEGLQMRLGHARDYL